MGFLEVLDVVCQTITVRKLRYKIPKKKGMKMSLKAEMNDWIQRICQEDGVLELMVKAQIHDLAENIRLNPELSWKEYNACKIQVEYLKKHHFSVTTSYCGMDTAYRAEYSVGDGGPVFAFCAEYDALPDIGHACGHHLICGSALTAALLTQKYLQSRGVKGKVVLFGCPAEETGGGKTKMAAVGALDDVDALMMAHPTGGTKAVICEYAGVCSAEVFFRCEKSGSPVARFANPTFANPLDAQVLLYQAVALKRHYTPVNSAIVGVINDGGVRANVIPRQTVSKYTLRSPDIKVLYGLGRMLEMMAKGAAMMTGTTAEVKLSVTSQPTIPCLPLSNAFLDAIEARGISVPEERGTTFGALAGTDFGNFSQLRPGVHVHFPLGQSVAHHSPEFAEAAGTEEAYRSMFAAGTAMACVGIRFLSDASYRKGVQKAFRYEKKQVNKGA